MTIDIAILENCFNNFSDLILSEEGSQFKTFKSSKYINKTEHYKYSVYEEARENLGNTWWRPETIGTGGIQKKVSDAIKSKVNHNNQVVNNNLIDWRIKDSFSKRPVNSSLERTFFNFYKSKIKDSEAFDQFISEGLSYQLIAYLCFIKDINRFMPISQARFDDIFVMLGVDFNTSGNVSWENYSTYNDLIKQTRSFLRTKDINTTLLDAHSFLWIIGNQMSEVNRTSLTKALTSQVRIIENERKEVNAKPNISEKLSINDWVEILKDKGLTKEFDLSVFQTLYSFTEHKASAGDVAKILNKTHSPINLEIGRYAKRIATKYDIDITARSNEEFKYWDLYFNGWDEGTKFIWQLRPEIVKALEIAGLTGVETYPDELAPASIETLYEGSKRTVIVNSYERNSKARRLCIDHWKAACAVCEFDFEKMYGEIGKGFIHVHHLNLISQVGETYQVDPIKDLIPVCPNCHSMLHRKEPPYEIDQLKMLINR
jgi:5-methylcytosine-specific restriction enzyme A